MATSKLLTHPRVSLVALGLLALACAPKQPPEAPDTTPVVADDPAQLELQARLAYLEQRLEAARVDGHIPGMAIAIVKDDQLIYAHGFGVSDMQANTLVTPDTVFAIGSSTKAFTSTLIAMLVDEGKIDWDDPVTKHLPAFELKIDRTTAGEGEVVTIRDLLSHRAGFARMGVLWAANTIPREQVLAYATKAVPVAPFRAEFHYNNVTYMAAGEASAKAAGISWEQLLTTRLLAPLHMTHTSSDYASAQADPALSLGYIWRDDLHTFEPAPMRNLDSIAPAGSINSSVIDMANWLRFQLAEGEFEGQRLVSAAALAQTKASQIAVMPGTIDYGMGWMLGDWDGHRVVEHGGNIDGFAAAVAMLPDDGLGMVLLTNSSFAPVQGSAPAMVWEALLTDAYLPNTPGSGEDTSRFVGKYIADMPGFDGQAFEVVVKDGKLAVDVPGQTVYTLKAPDDDGRRVFELTDTIAVSFDEDDDGQVIALRLHQGGLDMELLREGIELAPEVDVARVQPYLGRYRAEEGTTANVLIHNGRLAVDIPGQMVYDLELPNASGDYYFRVTHDIFVNFKLGEGKHAAEVVSLTLFQAGKPVTFTHEPGTPLITLEQLHRKRKTDQRERALVKAGLVRLESKVDLINAGITGTEQQWFDPQGQFRQQLDLSPVGTSLLIVHAGEGGAGLQGWSESSFDPRAALQGVLLQQALGRHPRVMFGDWRDDYESETVLRTESGEHGEFHVVELRSAALPSMRVHIDAKTGDVIEIHGHEVVAGGLRIATTTKLSDYRKVEGMRLPFHVETTNLETGTIVATLLEVATKQPDEPGRFAPMPTD